VNVLTIDYLNKEAGHEFGVLLKVFIL